MTYSLVWIEYVFIFKTESKTWMTYLVINNEYLWDNNKYGNHVIFYGCFQEFNQVLLLLKFSNKLLHLKKVQLIFQLICFVIVGFLFFSHKFVFRLVTKFLAATDFFKGLSNLQIRFLKFHKSKLYIFFLRKCPVFYYLLENAFLRKIFNS